ncbi:MAG: AAA family ATPase [Planctomycetota bacterium]
MSASQPSTAADEGGADIQSVLDRIQELTRTEPDQRQAAPAEPPQVVEREPAPLPSVASTEEAPSDAPQPVETRAPDGSWVPVEPCTLEDAGVTETQLEHLVLKALNAKGELSGRGLSEQHTLPFRLVNPVLQAMKLAQLVAFRGAAPMNDYVYQLTELGREHAKKLSENCSYFGSAPVTLESYIASVSEQTLTKTHPTQSDLKRAFGDLLINQAMFKRLGPAVNSGRGLFLFGQPGNGKTSIAERITKAFGDSVWIPRAIGIDGEIMRVFDPGLHEEDPLELNSGPLKELSIDHRWIRIKRPTIVVGGELTMDSLEVTPGAGKNLSEAPLQMKSNTGTLVIDDFGRQRMTTDELLNRWIVPLEKRYDFLQLTSGKKIQVPFDQLIVFSTNLEPKDLVDDAFLRRIPYKIEVLDPSEDEFRKLFEIMAPIVGVEYEAGAVDYLIDKHYRPVQRPFRCCQPRDLLLQIRNYCAYIEAEPKMSTEYFDYAVDNYFAVM